MSDHKLGAVKAILRAHFKTRNQDAFDNAALDIVEEIGRQPERKETVPLTGFMPIGDMTREELINECLAHHRVTCETVPVNELKNAIINSRLADFQRRLITEAKLDPPTGFFGMLGGSSPIDTDDK